MVDHVHDLESLRTATERLLSAAEALGDEDVAGASLLPGWTRGHLLAHLARNADALVEVLAGRPMYASPEARDSDIARDAPRGAAAQLLDLRESAERFAAAAAAPGDWSRTVELRNGVQDTAARVPFRRLVEVELHHVDLGTGYRLEDLPGEFVLREIAFLTERFAGHPDVPPLTVSVAGAGEWRTGRKDGGTVTVAGPPADVVGWLSGRRDGALLHVSAGALPALPPL
ncbi:maleylpyruvate isomerase family mycothiol-dependent enzyme [Streptomyces sp. NPDC050560]|uniref:maleylpyruvate isomerase family mycothiol-dependent enzyme n=1 Tax=Streptomyces sp. NPDC050560 TaxID=3365630 RepID=UPI003796C0EC